VFFTDVKDRFTCIKTVTQKTDRQAFEEIDVTNPIRILPFDENKLESLVEKGYGITAGSLPANTYKN
ncbi:hypothetical protein ABU914_10365, partial [Bacillaceae bacterium YX66]